VITRARIALFGRAAASDPPHKVITGRAHKDPICGTYVAEELAIKATAAGQVHYFCSPECRDRFLNGPET
jgi:YHS domain-containing protein